MAADRRCDPCFQHFEITLPRCALHAASELQEHSSQAWHHLSVVFNTFLFTCTAQIVWQHHLPMTIYVLGSRR